MNWTFLLTIYGTPPVGPNPLVRHFAETAESMLLVGTDESLGYQVYNKPQHNIPELVVDHQPKPFTHYMFADAAPDVLSVVNKGKTFFSYMAGNLADGKGSATVLTEHMLNINRDGRPPVGTTYTDLLNERVMAQLHGKFSMAIAELGPQPTFIFRSQKLPFKAWLLAYDGMYYMLVSNQENAADDLEAVILGTTDPARETYYQQDLGIPNDDATLALRPVYAITKFRTRIKSYVDKSSRKLLICNYFRHYIRRQCVSTIRT